MPAHTRTERTATTLANAQSTATLTRGGELANLAKARGLAALECGDRGPLPAAPASARSAANLARRRLQLARALEYASVLAPLERELLCGLAEQGFSITAVSRLSGQPVGIVRRMLCDVAARTGSPLFIYVAKNHKAMPPTMRAVAGAVILRGGSLRSAAAELGLTLWAVRQQRDKVLTRFVHRADAPGMK